MAQKADSRINFEVMVILICLNSILVPIFSDTRIRVPSERTTRSRGEMRKANGKAIHSIIRKAT